MVLPASFSTDAQAAFEALLASCDAQVACRTTYPRLRQDWAALLASLPRPVTALQPLTGQPEQFTLTREIVLSAVRGALYTPAMAAAVPAAVSEAAAGRVEALVGLGALMASRKGQQLAMGMHFSIICAEDAPPLAQATDVPGQDFGREFATLYQRACAQWPRGAVSPAFYSVPPTQTPTLLISGGIDPATPPRHGERIAAALGPAARHLVVPNAGHSVLGVGCARDLLYRFIAAADDGEAAALDATCLTAVPRPGVFVPMNVTVGKPP